MTAAPKWWASTGATEDFPIPGGPTRKICITANRWGEADGDTVRQRRRDRRRCRCRTSRRVRRRARRPAWPRRRLRPRVPRRRRSARRARATARRRARPAQPPVPPRERAKPGNDPARTERNDPAERIPRLARRGDRRDHQGARFRIGTANLARLDGLAVEGGLAGHVADRLRLA